MYKDNDGNIYEKPKGGNGTMRMDWTTEHYLNDLTISSLLNKIGDGIFKIIDSTKVILSASL